MNKVSRYKVSQQIVKLLLIINYELFMNFFRIIIYIFFYLVGLKVMCEIYINFMCCIYIILYYGNKMKQEVKIIL